VYYWLKFKKGVQLSSSSEDENFSINDEDNHFTEFSPSEISEFDTLIDDQDLFNELNDLSSIDEQNQDIDEENISSLPSLFDNSQENEGELTGIIAADENLDSNSSTNKPTINEKVSEKEFEKKMDDALKYVDFSNFEHKKQSLQDKKKETNWFSGKGEPIDISSLNKKQSENDNRLQKKHSRAMVKKDRTETASLAKVPSILKVEHKELYDEISLNNWIYYSQAAREKLGIYKPALDETRFREKDISYLLEARIIFKILLPHPTGEILIYSIQPNEGKKIIQIYLSRIAKNNNYELQQKTVNIKDYQHFSLDRKSWRFDFYVPKLILGKIWLTNFLLEDTGTDEVTLTYQSREEVKALLATTQIHFEQEELIPIIITDYQENGQIIEEVIEKMELGNVNVLLLSDKKFEKRFLKLLAKKQKSL
jgi:hypothetical protein